MLNERELRRGLKTKIFGNRIYSFESIDSTNNCAKAVANVGGGEGVVVIAEEQTAGKGRLGRTWLANPTENLMFSVLLRPKVSAEAMQVLPLYVAVAVAKGIEQFTQLRVECKWPNDLLINKKKVAGILLEGALKDNSIEHVIVGLGINVNQTQFSSDLHGKATSLRLELNKPVDRIQLFKAILTALEADYKKSARTGFESVLPFWQERSTMLNKSITVSQSGTTISGIVRGLSKDGGLILQTNGKEKTLFAGDVTILNDAPEPSSFQPSPSPQFAATKL